MISYHFDTPSVFHAHSYVWGFRPVLRFPALLLGSRTGPVSSVSVFFALVVFLLSSPVLSIAPVSYTHLTLPTKAVECRSRWSPYH